MPATIPTNLAKAWSLVLDLVYPPRCGGCDRRGTLMCERCLALIDVPLTLRSIERLDAVVSAGDFKEPLRSAIHKLKYESDTPLAKPLALLISGALDRDGRWVAEDGEPPVIVAVPLHSLRKRARGYNQSDLLARELGRLTGWPIDRRLVRIKATRDQVGLHGVERHENVRDAFQWLGEEAPLRVLLVDDVCTTGATLSECAFALMSAGTEHIYAATVAMAFGDGPEVDS
jgi:competence protein ComFC